MEVATCIVGTKFRGPAAVEAIAQMREGDEVRLVREPENKYDTWAVACHYLGLHVGYVPKQANPKIAAALDAGLTVTAIVREPPRIRAGRVDEEPALTVRLG
jgi:hypothetical protein